MGARYQFPFARMHHKIMHRHIGQSSLQRTPGIAPVSGDIHTTVGAHIEDILHQRVFPDDVDRLVRQSLTDIFEGFTQIIGAVNVSTDIIVAIAVECDIGTISFMGGCLDPAYPAIFWQFAGHVLPMVPTTFGHPQLPIIAAGPDQAELQAGFRHRGQRAVGYIATVLRTGQILADGGPCLTLIHRAIQAVGTEVHHIGVVRREDHRRIPVVAQGRVTEGVAWPHLVASATGAEPGVITKL